MNDELTIIPEAQTDAELYVEPAESYQAELRKKFELELAKELKDYELMNECFVRWLYQRIRTTELIAPNILHGGDGKIYEGNDIVTLESYGLSKMQWSRRKNELSLKDRIEEYVDYCVAEEKQPTLYGFYSFGKEGTVSPPQVREYWGSYPEGIPKATVITLVTAYQSFEDKKEADAFLARFAKRLPDRIAEDMLDKEVDIQPWFEHDFKLDGFNTSPEHDLLYKSTFAAFEELSDKDPMVVLQALSYILEDGGEWKDVTIPVLQTWLKKARERRSNDLQ